MNRLGLISLGLFVVLLGITVTPLKAFADNTCNTLVDAFIVNDPNNEYGGGKDTLYVQGIHTSQTTNGEVTTIFVWPVQRINVQLYNQSPCIQFDDAAQMATVFVSTKEMKKLWDGTLQRARKKTPLANGYRELPISKTK